MPAKEALPLLLTGAVIAVHWVAFYGSVKYGNVSIAVVCISGCGFFTAFLEPLLYKKQIVLTEVLLGAMSIAGIWIIFDFHPQYKTGILFGLVSAIGGSLFLILNKRLLKKHPSDILTLYEMSGGLMLLTGIIPFYLQLFPAAYYIPSFADLVWLLILALICTVYGFQLQLHALKKISAFTANLTYNLEPIYGIALAFIFFKENQHFTFYFSLGVGLILLSVLFQMANEWYRNSQGKMR